MDRKELRERIQTARTRGEQKRLGQWLDEQDDTVRKWVLEIAREAGVSLPPEALQWPGKKLIRRARARQDEARERKNPIRRDEAFECAVCGIAVSPGGARVRDHCPHCLHSLHVDRVPGDRAAGCGGHLVPMSVETQSGELVIGYHCDRCDHRHRCRAHPDDRKEVLIALTSPHSHSVKDRMASLALPRRVREFCDRQDLLSESLSVAVSGGVDSMVLMHVLVELGYRPLVVTIDHGIRAESADEVRFVREEAERLGLKCLTAQVTVNQGPNLSERAREARYGVFEGLDVTKIALGHHQDDQVETVLDRLMRGAGARGLAGIPPVRGRYVRPLMEESRSSIEAWATMRRIPFLEDPSNRKGTRGRIRHEIVPVMRDMRKGFSRALARSADHLREDDQWLTQQAMGLIGPNGISLPQQGDESIPAPLLRRAILELVRQVRGHSAGLSATQISQIGELARPGSWLELGEGYRVVRDQGFLRVLPHPPIELTLQQGTWGIWNIRASAPVLVRGIRDGESGGGTSFRERLREAGVGAALRDLHPVVIVEGRRWLPGVWLEPAEQVSGVTVLCECPPQASIPPGGPFTSEL